MKDVHVFAPAKINIGLRVMPRRADGFHGIESIFQTIDICDELFVKADLDSASFCVHCDTMDLPKENTLYKTYRAFCKLTGKTAGVSVEVTKRIPAGGGLGGASSDAASFLRALCEITGTMLSIEEQDEIASEVGSDVFFFLRCPKSGCAIVSGRGENVYIIKPRYDIYVLLVFLKIESLTREAYMLFDKYIEHQGKSKRLTEQLSVDDIETIYNAPVNKWNFSNSFTPVLIEKYPLISKAISEVSASGALFSDMSGAGSTVFGIFDTIDTAKSAANKLAQNWDVRVAATAF